MTDAAQMKAWQKGYELEDLKRLSSIFRDQDKPYVLGAFGAVKENRVADELAAGRLHYFGGPSDYEATVAVIARKAKNHQDILDFAGSWLARTQPGDLVVRRMAARPGKYPLLASWLREALAQNHRVWVEAWQESPELVGILRSLQAKLLGVKVTAASELIGVWRLGPGGEEGKTRAFDFATLCQVRLGIELDEVAGLAAALDRVQGFAQHYSQYNKGKSWSALSLRGYYDDPALIHKPREMSKRWKDEHPGDLDLALRDTELRYALPEAEALLSRVPGRHHRVRLMRLEPGGGELERHADNTDPDAGTRAGELMRIHIPLVTNPGVVFEGWRLDGARLQAHMAHGEAWYLDTRKPHTAVNNGPEPRVHLVVDVEANALLLSKLADPAEVVSEVHPASIIHAA